MQVIVFIIFVLLLTVFFSLSSSDRHMILGKKHMLEHDGRLRTYHVHVPNKYDKPALVVVLHGFASNARQMAYITGIHNVVDGNTLVVYPNASEPTRRGMKAGWNSGYCCGSGWVNKVDDVSFIKLLVDSLAREYGIDKDKVYISGFSNGAMMAQRIAVELPQMFSGFASVSGSIGTTSNVLHPNKAVPALLMHGKKDRRIPYEGGSTTMDPDFTWRSFHEGVSAWRTVNGFGKPTSLETEAIEEVTYQGSKAVLHAVTYKESGHKWPDWRLANVWHRTPEGSSRVMSFFLSLDKAKR